MPTKPLFSAMMKEKSSAYPARGSSLSSKHDQLVDDAQALFDNLKARKSPTERTAQPKSGLDHLAAERAKLLLLQRQIIQDLSRRLGFSVGWPGVRDGSHGKYARGLSEVSLSDEEKPDLRDESANGNDTETISPAGIYNMDVLRAASSEDEIRLVYEVRAN
jgi:trafficking protein particle complex subunit 10